MFCRVNKLCPKLYPLFHFMEFEFLHFEFLVEIVCWVLQLSVYFLLLTFIYY